MKGIFSFVLVLGVLPLMLGLMEARNTGLEKIESMNYSLAEAEQANALRSIIEQGIDSVIEETIRVEAGKGSFAGIDKALGERVYSFLERIEEREDTRFFVCGQEEKRLDNKTLGEMFRTVVVPVRAGPVIAYSVESVFVGNFRGYGLCGVIEKPGYSLGVELRPGYKVRREGVRLGRVLPLEKR